MANVEDDLLSGVLVAAPIPPQETSTYTSAASLECLDEAIPGKDGSIAENERGSCC